jgi:hypothetical protein
MSISRVANVASQQVEEIEQMGPPAAGKIPPPPESQYIVTNEDEDASRQYCMKHTDDSLTVRTVRIHYRRNRLNFKKNLHLHHLALSRAEKDQSRVSLTIARDTLYQSIILKLGTKHFHDEKISKLL